MIYALNSPEELKVKTAMKLVLRGDDEKVVGLHCIGPHSGNCTARIIIS